MEEKANLEYYELLMINDFGQGQKIGISDIANRLNAQGYQIEEKQTIGEMNIDKESIKIATKGTGTIQLSYAETQETDFYAVVDGKYYKMELNEEKVTIDKTETIIKNGECVANVEIEITSGTSVTVGNVTENAVTLNAGVETGVSVVKVKCGEISKECMVSVIKKPVFEEENSEVDFNRDYGLVDVIWLSGTTNNYSETPNVPYLYDNSEEEQGLTPVTWTFYKNGTQEGNKTVNWVEDENAKTNWYNYSDEKGNDGKEDNTTSMWANAKSSDGSYFVWIPRYAYRITYYSDPSYTNVTGYYDGYGMWEEKEGKTKYNLDDGIETVEHNEKSYIVHPAFMNDTNKKDSQGNALADFDRGGWDKEQTGIWIAKYEVSREDSEDKGITWKNTTTTGNVVTTNAGSDSYIRMVSKPGLQSWRKIIIGNMYVNSLAYDTSINTKMESHLIKNSEWGAAVFLAHSQYGRNGHEVDANSSYTTGNGDEAKITDVITACDYNTVLGAKASTTGNVYGIYDMAGGAWEHVAGYNKLGEAGTRMNSGKKMLNDATDASGNYISTKYATAYSNGEANNSSISILLNMGKVGEATKEVRKTSEDKNWFSDYGVFVMPKAPFVGRGGGYDPAGIEHGIFYSDSTHGQAINGVSFRIALGQ